MNAARKRKISSRILYLILADIFISIISTYIFFSLRYENYYLPFIYNFNFDTFDIFTSGFFFNSVIGYALCSILSISIFYLGNIYSSIIEQIDIRFITRVIFCIFIYAIILFILLSINSFGIPKSIVIIQPIIFFFLFFLLRVNILFNYNLTKNENLKKIIIYGAGVAGYQLLNSLNQENKFEVVAFIDDDKKKIGKKIYGLPIISNENAKDFVIKYNIEGIIISIPSLSFNEKKRIIRQCENFNIKISTLPNLSDLIDNKISFKDVKSLNITDLISRNIKIENSFENKIENKIIMITGAGGSIGSELCKQIILLNPSKMVLLDNSEFSLYKTRETLSKLSELKKINLTIEYSLTSVTQIDFLKNIIIKNKPDYLFHAAAYKHVGLVEENPKEAIINNFFGTYNIALLSHELGVRNFILISSDKAVRPTSIMGATKRLSELVVQSLQKNEKNKTIFSMVRFGNVLGSSGSVVNKFDEQIENGEYVTVTHPEVRRYFMTIQEAVNLILQSSVMAKGGEIFLLDMGKPIKIIDLAKKIIDLKGLSLRDSTNPNGDIEIKITGLKKGEKLYEELLIDGSAQPSQNPNIYFGKDSFLTFGEIVKVKNDLEKLLDEINENKILKILSNITSMKSE